MNLKKIENTNIYEFVAEGKMTEQDARNLLNAFREFKENGEKINLLGVIRKLPIPDFAAIDEFFNLKIESLHVVQKYAIVSDQTWLKNLVPTANFFTPNIPIKTFDSSARDQAILWLNEHEVKSYQPDDYLTTMKIEELEQDVFEVEFEHDKIDFASMNTFYQILDRKSKHQINLLLILKSFPVFENLKTLIKGIQVDLKAVGKLGKYAIVTDQKWIDNISGLADFLTPGLELKVYKISELDEARKWISD